MSLVWQSVLLDLYTGVLRIPTTSLRTGLGMTREFLQLLSLPVAIRPPVLSAPLPKGGWHGEAVTGGFLPARTHRKREAVHPARNPSTSLRLVPLPLGKGGRVFASARAVCPHSKITAPLFFSARPDWIRARVSAKGSLVCSPVFMSLQATTPAAISSPPRKIT